MILSLQDDFIIQDDFSTAGGEEKIWFCRTVCSQLHVQRKTSPAQLFLSREFFFKFIFKAPSNFQFLFLQFLILELQNA